MKHLLFLLLTFHVCASYAQTCNEVSVYFKTNKSALTKQDAEKIKQSIASLKPFTFQSVRIEGYSDTTGSEKSNMLLSQKRIDAARRVLKPLIDTSVRIETINHGESKAASTNDLSKNRYAKITFVLDTLINIAEKGKGQIWLNLKSLYKPDLCNFQIRVWAYIRTKSEYYSAIPISDTSNVYHVNTTNNCFNVYYFPKAFYNSITHIAKFPKAISIYSCSQSRDSINFSGYASEFQYDSISESYYLILDCNKTAGVCCATKGPCTSIFSVPEETSTHKTLLTRFAHFGYREPQNGDTLFISDSLLWKKWYCDSFDYSDSIYSIAVFNSTYYYLNGKIRQYAVNDSLYLRRGKFIFEMQGKKYYDTSATAFVILKRTDYTSFSSPTKKRLIVKAKRGSVPGYYVKEYDVVVPFEHVRGKRYIGYAINYPTEFGLQQNNTIIREKELNVKRKVKKSKTVIRLTLPKQ
ncbi:OmpA family protein [Cytophaga aurantiaca]|uniref:OmpA family protein n=1 Tax=Cytophaga aurantiaca TaxID=29530 RepID=UPI00039B7BC1|nr:OmpA family protein [Cytophaga aurantiaca]